MLLKKLICLCTVLSFVFLNIRKGNAQQTETGSIQPVDTTEILNLIRKGADHAKSGQEDIAVAVFKQAWQESRRIQFHRGSYESVSRLGIIVHQNGFPDSAQVYLFMGLHYAVRTQDKAALASIWLHLGLTYDAQMALERALKAFTKATQYTSDTSAKAYQLYTSIGNVFHKLNQPEKAKSYYLKAFELASRRGDALSSCGMLINLGISSTNETDYVFYLDSARKLAFSKRFMNEAALASINLSNFYRARGNLQLARAIGEEVLQYPDSLFSNSMKHILLVHQGRIHIADTRYEDAETVLKRSMSYSGDYFTYITTLETLIELYQRTGNWWSAFQHQCELHGLQDSLQSKEIALNANELETKYRMAEKDRIIAESHLQLIKQKQRLQQQKTWTWISIATAIILILSVLWRYSHLKQKNRRLISQMEIQELKSRIAGEEQERARIAAELHDGVVSELTAIRMNLEAAGHPLSEKLPEYAQQLSELGKVINDIRNTAHNLMPEIFLRHGLPEAVGMLAEGIRKSKNLETEYHHFGDFTALDTSLRQSVYRIIQELLQNIIKHSQASKALLQLSCHDGLLTVSLEDNGIGIPPRKTGEAHMGMESIRQRVAAHMGKIEWQKGRQRGTLVYIEFEIPEAADRTGSIQKNSVFLNRRKV